MPCAAFGITGENAWRLFLLSRTCAVRSKNAHNGSPPTLTRNSGKRRLPACVGRQPCRQHSLHTSIGAHAQDARSRQAAKTYRPAACAPQKSGFNPREQRHWFAEAMFLRQTTPGCVGQFIFVVNVELVKNLACRIWQNS